MFAFLSFWNLLRARARVWQCILYSHNYNFGHPWEGNVIYADSTSVMGQVYRRTVYNCYNGVHYHHAGWLANRTLAIDAVAEWGAATVPVPAAEPTNGTQTNGTEATSAPLETAAPIESNETAAPTESTETAAPTQSNETTAPTQANETETNSTTVPDNSTTFNEASSPAEVGPPIVTDLSFYGHLDRTADDTVPGLIEVAGFYIVYNRATGINRETKEYPNAVLLHRYKVPGESQHGSDLVAVLVDDNLDETTADRRIYRSDEFNVAFELCSRNDYEGNEADVEPQGPGTADTVTLAIGPANAQELCPGMSSDVPSQVPTPTPGGSNEGSSNETLEPTTASTTVSETVSPNAAESDNATSPSVSMPEPEDGTGNSTDAPTETLANETSAPGDQETPTPTTNETLSPGPSTPSRRVLRSRGLRMRELLGIYELN
jgi:hypothetical protein